MIWRFLRHRMLAALADTPVLFVNGARQVGKSTAAQQLIGPGWPARYLTLETIAPLSDDPIVKLPAVAA